MENFLQDVFCQEREYFLLGLEKRPLFDVAGGPITAAEFSLILEAVWGRLPVSNHIDVRPIETQVAGDEGSLAVRMIVVSIGLLKQDFYLRQHDAYI